MLKLFFSSFFFSYFLINNIQIGFGFTCSLSNGLKSSMLFPCMEINTMCKFSSTQSPHKPHIFWVFSLQRFFSPLYSALFLFLLWTMRNLFAVLLLCFNHVLILALFLLLLHLLHHSISFKHDQIRFEYP